MDDPRLSVMYRYVEEYTNAHDLSVAREIMHPDYRFTMGATTLDLPAYLGMVDNALGHFTDLRLDVNSFVVGPDRLAMKFHESATSLRHSRRATWPGIALYDFHEDGRLLSVEVEQDFWGRRRQFAGEAPHTPVPSTDPSVWTSAVGSDQPATRVLVQSALRSVASHEAVTYDDGSPLMVDASLVAVHDVIVSDRDFAAWIAISGAYLPHPASPPLAVEEGAPITFTATGTGTLDPDGTVAAHFVTDRYGAWTRHRPIP